jgi:hypothetical protein
LNAGQTLSTPLYTYESSIEFTTRIAKLLARKTGKPIYVGNSISFASAGMGGTVEEEIEGFKKVVEIVMDQVRKGPISSMGMGNEYQEARIGTGNEKSSEAGM